MFLVLIGWLDFHDIYKKDHPVGAKHEASIHNPGLLQRATSPGVSASPVPAMLNLYTSPS